MNGKLYAKVDHRRDVTYVTLAGIIDEDNQLEELFHPIFGSTVVINAGEVARINSCGVRDWVNWLARLDAWGIAVVLDACSPAIVAQLNLVRNFARGAHVKSFYAPYFCADCPSDKLLLLDVDELGPVTEPPVCRCDDCDQVMEFDDLPEAYFGFLTELTTVVRLPEAGTRHISSPRAKPPSQPPPSYSNPPTPLVLPVFHVVASVLLGVIAGLSYVLIQ